MRPRPPGQGCGRDDVAAIRSSTAASFWRRTAPEGAGDQVAQGGLGGQEPAQRVGDDGEGRHDERRGAEAEPVDDHGQGAHPSELAAPHLLEDLDVVLVPNPSYPIHPYGFVIAGADIRHVPIGPDVTAPGAPTVLDPNLIPPRLTCTCFMASARPA